SAVVVIAPPVPKCTANVSFRCLGCQPSHTVGRMNWPDTVEGPYCDELTRGQKFAGAPGVTLTEGHAAVHQAIVGDRMRLPLDHALCAEVTGNDAALGHPALVWDLAIRESPVHMGVVR